MGCCKSKEKVPKETKGAVQVGCVCENNTPQLHIDKEPKPVTSVPLETEKPDPEYRDGKWYYKNGDIYEGIMKEGKYEGYGIFTGKSGYCCEATFAGGEAYGQAKITSVDGSTYEGNTRKSKRHGQGKYVSHEGWKYEGNYINNMQHGMGTYTWIDGDRYEGFFRNDDFDGKGKIIFTNGSTIEGTWKKGNQVGRIISRTVVPAIDPKEVNTISDAWFKKGEKNGMGYTYRKRVDGSIEEVRGTWKNGELHGYCVIKINDTVFYEGLFENGYAVGSKYRFKDSDNKLKKKEFSCDLSSDEVSSSKESSSL